MNHLYKHLLETSTGTTSLFRTTNGCCDAVMCSLAAIVTLETEMTRALPMLQLMDEHSQQMGMSMLHNKASNIRSHLLAINCTPGVTESYLVDDPFAESASETLSCLDTSDVFRHAALLYLSTVVNGHSPVVPETYEQVLATHQAFLTLPRSSADRSLVFPLCLVGCMTDDQVLRQYFSGRLRAMDGPVGNGGETLKLVEEIWRRRDNLHLSVGWRDVMRENG